MISEIHLNIGSNSGDSRAFIARAVAALRSAFAPSELAVSGLCESAPWGFESSRNFVNAAVLMSLERNLPWTADSLEELLRRVKEIEKSISAMPHRAADGSYADRELDIDIIAVDAVEYSSASLVIPHPHMAARVFVLAPMAELAPAWRHPRTGLTCCQMLSAL